MQALKSETGNQSSCFPSLREYTIDHVSRKYSQLLFFGSINLFFDRTTTFCKKIYEKDFKILA